MRSGTGWHHRLARELSDAWPASLGGFSPKAMLDVELAFYLLARVLPGQPGTLGPCSAATRTRRQ